MKEIAVGIVGAAGRVGSFFSIHWFGGRPTSLYGDVHIRERLDFDLQVNAMDAMRGWRSTHRRPPRYLYREVGG